MGKTYFANRNHQLAWLATLLKDRTTATILAGDLNTSPFSSHFRNLLQEAPHMQDARKGFGLAPTWPSGWCFAGTALDHILVSDELKVTSFETGPDIGSDHLPVMISVDF